MPDPNITVQGTPNPNAAKFTVDRTLVEGGSSMSYFDSETASDDALASRLFVIDGVESLLIAEDFVTVTKADSANWDDLVPQIENAIKEVLS
jgi:Scaffold protein Nfu/NifU N terminal